MNIKANTLRKTFESYGHFRISVEIDGVDYETITTNTMAIDAAFDDMYNYNDNSGAYYETQEEAQQELINEIVRANKLL